MKYFFSSGVLTAHPVPFALLRYFSVSNENDEDIDLDDWIPPDNDSIKKIVSQTEYYLSDDHLAKDAFLLKHVRRNKMGYVNIKLLTSFKKVSWCFFTFLEKHYKVPPFFCLFRAFLHNFLVYLVKCIKPFSTLIPDEAVHKRLADHSLCPPAFIKTRSKQRGK